MLMDAEQTRGRMIDLHPGRGACASRYGEVVGLSTREMGQTVLSGELLELERRLDGLFLRWAKRWSAVEYRFPPVIAAEHLDRLDYFQSFPHLATFPVALDENPKKLEEFAARGLGDSGEVHLAATAPVRHVLTPAACYHVYGELESESLEKPRYVTLRGTCFRREQTYAPLERQWAFSMREIVCLGKAPEVRDFLEESSARVMRFAEHIGLAVEWKQATDPFFQPKQNPKFLYQKLEPVKHELVFENRLAIGSTNFHLDYFGEAFGIQRNDEAAFSGCVAFGLERWIYAFLATYGPRPEDWPTLEDIEGEINP